jgi:hypothetical protein
MSVSFMLVRNLCCCTHCYHASSPFLSAKQFDEYMAKAQAEAAAAGKGGSSVNPHATIGDVDAKAAAGGSTGDEEMNTRIKALAMLLKETTGETLEVAPQAPAPRPVPQLDTAEIKGKKVADGTVKDVAAWLQATGFGDLAPRFVEDVITGEELISLDKTRLLSIDVTDADVQKRLLAARDDVTKRGTF